MNRVPTLTFPRLLHRVATELHPIERPLLGHAFLRGIVNSALSAEGFMRRMVEMNPQTEAMGMEEAALTRALQVYIYNAYIYDAYIHKHY